MARNTFLKDHVGLAFYHKEVIRSLDKAGSSHNRIVMLNDLIHDGLPEDKAILLDLQFNVEELSNFK